MPPDDDPEAGAARSTPSDMVMSGRACSVQPWNA